MKYFIINVIFFLFIILFQFISCDKYPTQNNSPYGKTILATNLRVIDNIDGIDLYSVNSQNNVYTFSIEDNYNTILIGDIILGTAHDGYIRRVTGLKRDSKILEVQTADATLDDAIINGGTDTTLYLQIGTDLEGSNTKLVSAAKGVNITKQGIDLSGLSLYSGVTEGVSVDVEILDGFITFDPMVDYGFGFNSNGLSHFHTLVSGILDYDYNLEVTANGKFGMTGLKNIVDFRHTTIQMLGDIPLLEVISVKIDIGFVISATIDGTFSCGNKAEYEVMAGARFVKGEWDETWTQNPAYEERPAAWPSRGEKHIRSYIRPRVTVSYFSVNSSQISVEPYSNYDAAISDYPSWCWELTNGIEGAYDFQFQVFGYQMSNYTRSLDQVEQILAHDCENIEDNIAPSQVNNLTAGNPTYNSINLFWSSTGDDGKEGKASEYDIRYLTSPIDLTNWSLARRCYPTPNPQTALNFEEYMVTGLAPETDYYFALRVADEVNNWSPISNVAMATTAEAIDFIRPSPISDLFAGSPTANTLTLTWTAPGDDGYVGTATHYDIRYSTEYISPYEWNSYIALPNAPTPGPSGTKEEFLVTNLVPNTIYYFAIKSADEVLNWSDMSNMAGERTAGRGSIIGEFASPTTSYTMDLAATESSIWIINQIGDTVYNVNLENGALNDKFNFAPQEDTDLRGVAFDGIYLWLATSSNIYKIDPDNRNEIGHFRYNQRIASITGLTWGNGRLWLAGPYEDKIYEIDTDRAIMDGHSDSSITNQVTFANPPSFRGVMYFDGGLFISTWTNTESATIREYDPATGEVLQQFQIRETDPLLNPIQGGLATDGQYFYTGGDNFRILIIKY